MHPFEVLADPVRRSLLATLRTAEAPAGALVAAAGAEFGISQPAVSRHLAVLRDHGFATARTAGRQRIYAADPAGLDAAQAALDSLAPTPDRVHQALDALHTEVARGKRQRRTSSPQPAEEAS